MGFAVRMLWSLAAGGIWEFSQGMENVFAGSGAGCESPWSRGVGSWPVGAFHCLDAGDEAQLKGSRCPLGSKSASHSGPATPAVPTSPHHQPKATAISPQALLDPHQPHQASAPKMQLGFLLGDGRSGHSSLGNNTSLLIFSSLLISKSFK